jgi:hypothetical protein
MPDERKNDRHQDALLDTDCDHCRSGEDGKIELARALAEYARRPFTSTIPAAIVNTMLANTQRGRPCAKGNRQGTPT